MRIDQCRVSADELAHDRAYMRFNFDRANAIQLLSKVESAARIILDGATISAQHHHYNGAQIVGTYVANYNMQVVAERFADEIDKDFCSAIHRGEPSAITKAQKRISVIAREVAFDCLDITEHEDYKSLCEAAQ